MGNILGTKSSIEDENPASTSITRKRKDRLGNESDDQYSDVSCSRSYKRRRLKSTSEYIYNALFLQGENSDIKIRALGQEWDLHKVYLRQAGYFSGMFNSSWKETSMKVNIKKKLTTLCCFIVQF